MPEGARWDLTRRVKG